MVVVTSDHGTGGFMLNGADDGYEHAAERFLKLGNCKGSFTEIESRLAEERSASCLIQAVEEIVGITLNKNEKLILERALDLPDERSMYDSSKQIADALKPVLFDRFSVDWTSHNHTADLVEAAIMGPVASELPAMFENWELHGLIRETLSI